MVMSFAHTLGEFGIVLMVGGNIPDETQTIAIAIYDKVQAFDNHSASIMSFTLLLFSMITISFTYWISEHYERKHV
jgi:molybdate transport system permease protein